MEFLKNLFGNLSSGVIRLAVTVGILAAVYFFIVKPVLHTTEKTVESTNHQIEKSFEHSVHVAKTQGGMRKTEKLLHCIQRAHQNVHRIERCSRRYS